MKKINEKKALRFVLIASLFQIILLITLPFAQSYSVEQPFNADNKIEEKLQNEKYFLKKGFNFLIGFFSFFHAFLSFFHYICIIV